MELKETKGYLKSYIETLDYLVSALNDEGRELDAKEKTMIRKALANTYLEDIQGTLTTAFVHGEEDQCGRILQDIHRTLSVLI